ncbi:MAG: helix-turn-helix domain-containing protein [Bacteroidales bacterium]|nr:helix-turn-helix transcriptional regulator [Candidatus Cryptobacteroides faecihippi]MCQ2162038.1 helix-turn-helix domain-containing protein [Bacteroidales bacterium]
MDEETRIKENIRRRRNNLGITQTEMARLLDITLHAYRKLESGDTRIFTKSFRTFARETETPINELVTGFSIEEGKDLMQLREEFDRKMDSVSKSHNEEVRELSAVNLRLQKEIIKLEAMIRDKDDIIRTDKKLIRQYEKRISKLESMD